MLGCVLMAESWTSDAITQLALPTGTVDRAEGTTAPLGSSPSPTIMRPPSAKVAWTDVPDDLRNDPALAGKYELVRLIGAGGMGAVISARQVELGRLVAIKVIHGARLIDARTIARFLREARAAASLESDHAVRIYDVGRLASGLPFIVMEHLEGADLAEIVRARSVGVEEAVEWIAQACVAIGEAHSKGLVHRDLKPHNIFLARVAAGERVKVLDFGLAKEVATSSRSELTSKEDLIGSAHFMSPEQIENPSTVGPAADIWALGATLFALLAGRPPFQAPTSLGVLADIVSKPPPDLLGLNAAVPEHVARAVERCLSKAPADRFHDVDALVAALRERPRHTVAQPQSSRTRVLPAAAAPARHFAAPARNGRNRWVVAIVAVTGAGLALATATTIVRRTARSEPAEITAPDPLASATFSAQRAVDAVEHHTTTAPHAPAPSPSVTWTGETVEARAVEGAARPPAVKAESRVTTVRRSTGPTSSAKAPSSARPRQRDPYGWGE